MLIFDTSAWVEYFIGSLKGKKIKAILESGEKIATPIIVLIELSCKAHKENINFSGQMDFIKQNSVVLNLNEEMVSIIGKTYVELKKGNGKIGLADAIIASMAKMQNANLVTCDFDFKDLSGVKLIE